jgi:D-arabinose 1-dehydrogenase-like Zn-dependent alcohol dehydrogenase
MIAAVLREFGAPLELAEVPEPAPGPGEVLVEVRAVGLCGTDLKIMAGMLQPTPLPLIPGHEVAGVVAAGDSDLAPGTPVACYGYDPCGQCRWCLAGQETLCPRAPHIGFDLDGGLARFVLMKRRNLLPFGPAVSFEEAAVAMDAVLSPWRALRVRAQLQPGERVVVGGAGGLGLNGLQVAVGLGAPVAVIEPAPARRQVALELGAELAVTPEDAGQVVEWSEGGAPVGFEASGTRGGFDAVASCLRPGARLVCCGYRPGVEYGLDSAVLVLREITLVGSRNGSRADAREALGAVEQGSIRPLISRRLPLRDVERAFSLLRAAEEPGRIVVQV